MNKSVKYKSDPKAVMRKFIIYFKGSGHSNGHGVILQAIWNVVWAGGAKF